MSRKQIDVQIRASRIPTQVGGCLEMAAHRYQTFARVPLDAKHGRALDASSKTEPLRHQPRARDVELHQLFPFAMQQLLERRQILRQEWRACICLPDAFEMLFRPRPSIVDL